MEKYLIYVNYVGSNSENKNVYELIFYNSFYTSEEWSYDINCTKKNLYPISTNTKSYFIKTNISLDLAQDSCCFGMKHCQDGILPLAFENIDYYQEYPEHRLILHYGITYDETVNELAKCNITIDEKSEEI